MKKNFKLVLALVLAAMMIVSMGALAATQSVTLTSGTTGSATITINNPAKGETYTIYRLFDATVGSSGTIAYRSDNAVPNGLTNFFTRDSLGNITPTSAILPSGSTTAVMTDELKAALGTWASSAQAVNSAVSDGSEALSFTNLPYGYYVVVTTHKSDPDASGTTKSAITVDSTNPNASVYDKNVNTPHITKTVEQQSYSIGDTVKYTATFPTSNYLGEGAASKQVAEYIVTDTLPPYLSGTKVTKIKIGTTEYTGEGLGEANFPGITSFASGKTFTIPWATEDAGSSNPKTWTSKYAQGTEVTIEYEAVLTSITKINGEDKNVITLTANVVNDKGEKEPWDEKWDDHAEIITYAAALKKVDENDQPLAGATFSFAGLTLSGSSGTYTVVNYDPSGTSAENIATGDDGKLYILGLASGTTVKVTEYAAPDGYNKLDTEFDLVPQILSKEVWSESGERHFDKYGNLVSEHVTSGTEKTVSKNLSDLDEKALKITNRKGTVLPSTGGIGTTIFYIGGSILVLAAAILLITKRRMSSND